MVFLSGSEGLWLVFIVVIFAIIGLVVFLLRKFIPGLTDYKEQNEKEITEDNLNRILVDMPEEKPNNEVETPDDVEE